MAVNDNNIINENDIKYMDMSNKYVKYQELKNNLERLDSQISILKSINLNESDYKNVSFYKNDVDKLRKSICILQKEYNNLFVYIVENYKDCNDYIDKIINGEKKLILK